MLIRVVELEHSLTKLIASEGGCFRTEALEHVSLHGCIWNGKIGRRVDFEFVDYVADDAGVDALNDRDLIQLVGDDVLTSVLDDENFPRFAIEIEQHGVVKCLLRRGLVFVDLGSTRQLDHEFSGQMWGRVVGDERCIADCLCCD